MKIRNLTFALFATALVCFSAAQATGQPPPGSNNFEKPGARGNLIARELGLTETQKLDIQHINRRQRILLRDAQSRLRKARAAADTAIYSDQFDQSDVESKIAEVAMAQAEITKIRMMSEVAVRSVLSPEQVVKFRSLRERFKQQRRRAQPRRKGTPLRRDVRRNQSSDKPPPRQ